ncbi:MAG: hypothetical protein O2931_01640 [Planctomycetota bacterium]|nr:hypothetical protein [Planctomycetota bacterium]
MLSQTQTRREVRIRCIPEGSAITQLPIQWSSSDIGTWEWSLHDHTADAISIRVDAVNERSDAEIDQRTHWISFSEAMSREFTLVATSVVDSKLNKNVPLVAVPQATDQQATVQLSMDHAWRWNSLVPLVQLPFQPQDIRGSDGVPAMRARFRYDPSAIANSPVVELLPAHTSVPQLPTAWIWQQHIVNRVAQNGSTEHWTTYYVENFGSDHLQIRLPAGTQIRDLYRDGQHIAAMPNRTPRGNVLLPLIPHQKYSVFTVCHHSFRRPLENQEEIRFDRTTCTTPIHSTRESTVIPPGYLGSSLPTRSIVSTTLQQRLCGPFSPLISYETPSWSLWSIDFSGRIAQQEVLARIEKVLETLGKSVIESPAEFNWRNLLLVTALAVPEIRVDPSALRRNNLQPESLIPVQDSQQLSTREIGLALLQKASLVAVGTPLGVCLTDRTRTDQIRGYDKSQSDGSVVVDDGGSTQSLWQLFNECEEVSDWSTRQWPFVASPVHSPDVQLSDARERGWTVVESLDCGEAPLSVTIQRSDSFYAVGWTSLLIAFAVYFRLRHLGRGFVLASGCLSVAFALFVPFPYYPLASGIWIGWCCARLATYTFRSIELRSVRWGAVTFIGTAVWITQIAAPAMSAEPSPPIIDRQHNLVEGTSTSEIGRVLIPYDDNEPQKEGPYVYMSSELYRGLAEKSRKLKSLPGAWWIAAANYELVAETHQGQTTVTKAVARIDVGTVAPGTEIALPFRRKEVRSIEVQWDSTPTLMQARWRSDGEAILVVCPTGGTIPLRIEFSLEKPELNAENGISFQVPQVAVSQVALQVATSQANTTCPLQITSAVGVTRWDSANQTLFATLGDSRLLSIDVARLPQDQSDSAAGTMDQRISAVFAPGGIRLEIVGTWKLSKNGLRTIPWNIDPRWQLAESPRSESVQWIARRISTQRLLCEATHPLPDRGSIHLSFLVPVDRATPIFSLATAESPALPTRNRLLDWQVEGLVSTPQPLTNGVQLSKVGGDLVAASPSANSDIGKTPVYSIPDRESRWLLTWDANDRRLEGEREIIYSLESDRITARLAAEIDATSQAPLFHRIDIPSGWTVKRVDIRQLGKRVPIQWSQSSSSNHVAVWSEHPLDGHYRVTCVAEQLITDQGQMALPSLGVQGVVWRESVWKVAPPGRDVRWELDQADSIRVAESELSTGSNNDSWRDEAPRVLRWYPHTPQGNNQVATYLEHRGGAWHATVVGQRTVSNGRYDEIRLEIPADWQDRLVMESFDYDFQVAAVPHRVTLVIRPAVPVTNSLQYRFTCTLSATNGPDTVAPIIESPDVEQDEQFLVVPRTVADQAWAWQADGLSRVEQLPDSVRRPESLLEQVIYRAANNRFRLAGRPEGRTLESPDIPLCDAIVRLLPDGTFAGTVNFDVASPLTGACVVMAPPGVSIQQILVDAHLPQAHRTSTSQWQVDFGNTEFPQRISVAFHGTSVRDPSSSPGHDEVLKLPVLQNLAGSTWPAQSTLWTIVIPPRVTQRDVHYILRGMSTCNELAQRLVRLQNAQRLISAVHQQFGNNRESQRWTTGWSARWNRLMSLPTDDTATDEQKIAFDSFVAWDRTNSLAISPGGTLSAEGSEFEIGGQTGANNSSVETVVRCSQTGWQPELTLQPVGLSTQSLAFLATCSTFSTAFLMAVLLYCSATARYWCARSKTLLTLAAGVASYLWLAPTAISYVIIAVAIATGWNRLRVYLVR